MDSPEHLAPSATPTQVVRVVSDSANFRIDAIDGLRALAILYVIASCAWHTAYFDSFEVDGTKPSHLAWCLGGWLAHGELALSVLLAISGFCLTRSSIAHENLVGRRCAADFYKARLGRIYPLYVLGLAVSGLVGLAFVTTKNLTAWDQSLPVSLVGILSSLTMIQDIVPVRSPNYTYWTLAILWHIYLLYPLIERACRRNFLLGWTTAVFFALYLEWLTKTWGGFDVIVPVCLAVFLFGVAGAHATYHAETRVIARNLPLELVAIICLFAATITAAVANWNVDSPGTLKVIFFLQGIGIAFLLPTLVNTHTRIRALLSTPVLSTIGRHSYEIFIFQLPVVALVGGNLVPPFLTPGWKVSCIAVTVITGLFIAAARRPRPSAAEADIPDFDRQRELAS